MTGFWPSLAVVARSLALVVVFVPLAAHPSGAALAGALGGGLGAGAAAEQSVRRGRAPG